MILFVFGKIKRQWQISLSPSAFMDLRGIFLSTLSSSDLKAKKSLPVFF